jgi:DNA helicase-2/ATP-dependent DNA helicase PcrA
MKRSESKKPVWARNMNEEQMAMILHDEGPCVGLAQAGSGKTRAVVHRIARMVDQGVDESRVRAVTFSKTAADEMNERLKKLDVTGARVGTWHSLALQIIKQSKLPQASWEVDESDRAKYVLKDVLGFKQMNWKEADLGQVSSFIGMCKANLYAPDSKGAMDLAKLRFGIAAQRACEAFSRFNDALDQKGLLTFDDFLVIVADHLANEDARRQWAAKWDFVIQDEAQDANVAQCTIAERLAADHRNYMIVGDVAQSIYGFRGALPELLANFAEKWNAKVVIMSKNYRSTRAVVDAANNIIRDAALRIETDMVCMRDEQGSARAVCADSLDDEAAVVVGSIQTMVKTGDAGYGDCTVLFRTNAQSRALEEKLLAEKVPYVVVGGVNFYERKEVKDLLAYLRLAAGTGTSDDVKRSINTPFRFLGAAFVERVMKESERRGTANADWLDVARTVAQQAGIQSRQRASVEQWAGLLARAQKEIANEDAPIRPSKVLDDVVRETAYLDFLRRDQGEESIENSAIANVREMVRVAERFTTAKELLDFIDENIRSAKKQRKDGQAGGERVLLMSIHRSKGLEWPHVFVVGLNEMILPHVRGDFEEERRLAYVAATRARDTLTLSYVRKIALASGVKEVAPSRFLAASGLLTGTWGSGVGPAGMIGPSAALPELPPLP